MTGSDVDVVVADKADNSRIGGTQLGVVVHVLFTFLQDARLVLRLYALFIQHIETFDVKSYTYYH